MASQAPKPLSAEGRESCQGITDGSHRRRVVSAFVRAPVSAVWLALNVDPAATLPRPAHEHPPAGRRWLPRLRDRYAGPGCSEPVVLLLPALERLRPTGARD